MALINLKGIYLKDINLKDAFIYSTLYSYIIIILESIILKPNCLIIFLLNIKFSHFISFLIMRADMEVIKMKIS